MARLPTDCKRAPELPTPLFVGLWERHPEADPASERVIEAGFEVGRQDHQAVKTLDALQQIIDLEVCVAVDAALDLRPLAEERVGLVEEQHHLALFGGAKDGRQVFFGLSDVFRDGACYVASPMAAPTQICCAFRDSDLPALSEAARRHQKVSERHQERAKAGAI